MLLYHHRLPPFCWVVFEVFLLLLNKLSFSDTTVIEGGRERKHSWDLSLLFWETQYSNQHPCLGQVCLVTIEELFYSKLWGQRPHGECPPKPYISFEQSYIFTKLHPQEGMSYNWLVEWNLQAPPLTTLSLSKIF